MKVAIIKYNGGNTQSLLFALDRLGCTGLVTDKAEEIRSADKVIFPGVGEAGSAMAYLRERGIDTLIRTLQQPVLGICLGMQLLCNSTEEGGVDGLGIFNVEVKRFTSLKVPHMGWNTVTGNGALFSSLTSEAYFYFVHSYYAAICSDTIAVTAYGKSFSSALKKRNFYGVQFHPEKSAGAGLQLLTQFLAL